MYNKKKNIGCKHVQPYSVKLCNTSFVNMVYRCNSTWVHEFSPSFLYC